MENIIRKAIEGGWKWRKSKVSLIKRGKELRFQHDGYTEAVDENAIVLDPLFWKALGKACWDNKHKDHNQNYITGYYLMHGITFHQINLLEGWDKAVEYLKKVTL